MIATLREIGLIPEAARRDYGYRASNDRDLHTLRFIRRARDLGYPISDIRVPLALWIDRSRSSADVKRLASARATELRERIAVLEGMRRALEDIAAGCHGDDRPDCTILHGLEECGHEQTR